jgi:MFS family permease
VANLALRRAALIQGLSNAGTSAAGLFIPLLAARLGASAFELGLIGACFGAALFVSAWVFGRLADAGRRRHLIRLGMLATALAVPLHVLAEDPAGLAVARGLFGFASGIYPSALISYAYDAQRRPGRFAGWGALGWGVGTLLAGLLGDRPEVFLASAAMLLAAFLVALRLEARPEVKLKVPWVPREVIATNLPAYLAMLTRHTGAAAVWIVFPLYLVDLGASPLAIGAIYFLNTGSQFLFMGWLDRFPAYHLVLAGLGSSVVVFLLFWAAPTWEYIVPVQLLLALSWGFLYVGTLAWVMERNVERATSTGLLHSSQSLAGIAGPLLGGVVAAWGGYGATMLFAAAMSAIGIPIFLASARRAERRAKERAAREVVVRPGPPDGPVAPPQQP